MIGLAGGRQGTAAPRTTFDRIRQPREWNDILLAGMIPVALSIAAPLGLVIAAITADTIRLLRRPWWTCLLVPAIGTVWVIAIGPDRAWVDYTRVYGELLAILGADSPASHLRDAAAEWVRQAAPISTVAGGLFATGWAGFLAMRSPTYRPHAEARSNGRRMARTARRIRHGTVNAADGGVVLGHRADGTLVELAPAELALHGLVLGGTGSGKTTAMLQVLRGLTHPTAGAGVVYVDLKGDPTLADGLGRLAEGQGRRLRVWTMAGPVVWNPLGRGDATEQRDKLMTTLGPYTQEFYEAAARRYLQTVLNVLHHPATRPPRPITLGDVDGLLSLDRLRRHVFGDHADDRLLSGGDPLAVEVDRLLEDYTADRELRSAVAGWRTRLATLRSATVGRWLDGSGIDLHQTMVDGDIVLFSLDSSRYQDAAAGIARAVVRDLVTVAAELQAHNTTGRLAGSVVVDEFSAAGGDDLLALFSRGRSAGVSTWLVTQDLADLDQASPSFAAQVVANTNVKLIGRVDVSESAESLAALAGTDQGWEETVQVTTDAPHLAPARGGATGMGSLRQVDRFRVHPNTIKELPRGQALLLVKHPTWRLDHLTVIPTNPTPRSQP